MCDSVLKTSLFLKISVIVILTLTLGSCYKNSVGCLDILSSNYAIGADDACDGCCTYPKILLKVNHTFNDANFQLDQEYLNNIGSRFIIREQQLFFSGLVFFDENDQVIALADSVKLTSNGVSRSFLRNFSTIRATVASVEMSSAKYKGTLSRVSFSLGLSDPISAIDSLSSTTLESLVRSKDNYIDGKYQSFYMRINKVGLNQDFIISTPINYQFSFDLKDLEVKAGSPLTLQIKINYAQLFADISFPTMSDSEIRSKVLANVRNAVTLDF